MTGRILGGRRHRAPLTVGPFAQLTPAIRSPHPTLRILPHLSDLEPHVVTPGQQRVQFALIAEGPAQDGRCGTELYGIHLGKSCGKVRRKRVGQADFVRSHVPSLRPRCALVHLGGRARTARHPSRVKRAPDLEQAALPGDGHSLRAVARAELGVDTAQMCLGGVGTHALLRSDLDHGLVQRQLAKQLVLAAGQ